MPTLDQRLAERTPPFRAPVGYQRWNDLLFLHWEIEPELIQRTLPDGLTVDTHDGHAYLGIVPFFMERIRPAFLPPVPWLSWFLELNVRTYVHDRKGRPGVYFYSLDCNQPIAVMLARRFFHLPYFHSSMQAARELGQIHYRSQRKGDTQPSDFDWQPLGSSHEAAPGSLEFFLVERYRLFTTHRDNKLISGQVHHAPYRIRPAEVHAFSTRSAEAAGFRLTGPMISPICAEAVDVSVFAVERCS